MTVSHCIVRKLCEECFEAREPEMLKILISLPQAAFRKVAMAQAFQDVAWLWSAVLLF
jgi:hypothetical protein